MKKKKEIFGWAMFDFANSAYTTNVVTVIFINYFIQSVVGPEPVEILGREVGGKSLWGFTLTISNLLIILTAPVLGAIADFSSKRKKFLVVTCLLCVLGTSGLFFATPGAIALAMILFVISNYFFQISESLCGSFLPYLAEPHEMGKVSALGWSLGYVGGLLGLILCYPLISGEDPHNGFGPANEWNVRISNLVTAGMFLVAAIPTFAFLKEHQAGKTLPAGMNYVSLGFSRVRLTLTHLRSLKDLSIFLVVFLLMSVSLTTVFTFSTVYSLEEMGFSTPDLMKLFVVVQVSAASGAFLFGLIQDRIGLKFSIQLLLLGWVAILLGVFFTYDTRVYWGLVLLLGAGLGSIQSAARAMIGLFAPASKSAEIFGFWSLTYKLGGMVGPLMYGFIADGSGHRWAMLFISTFYLMAFFLNFKVDEKRGREAAIEFEEKYAD